MISSQDFERLSAYLDNQLSSREKANLEARLAREPELKATLNELRQTVLSLRSLPVVKPPRNFMLSAKQVSAEPRRQWFPALRMATSLAALMLVLVFAGDFIASRAPAMSPAAPAPFTAAARSAALSTAAPSASAMPAAAAPLPAPTEMMDQSAVSGNAAGGEAPGGTAPTEANTPMSAAVLAAPPPATSTLSAKYGGEQPATAAEPTVHVELAPTEAAPALPPTETPPALAAAPLAATGGLAATEAPATPAAKSAAPQAAAPLAPTQTEAPVEATAPLAPADTFTSPATEAYPAPTVGNLAAPEQPTAPAPALPWREVEIGLIALTVLLAALTWLLRRR